MEANDDRSIGRFCLQRTELQWDSYSFFRKINADIIWSFLCVVTHVEPCMFRSGSPKHAGKV
jgi:hypothetical protein